jgi:hypothetical protein
VSVFYCEFQPGELRHDLHGLVDGNEAGGKADSRGNVVFSFIVEYHLMLKFHKNHFFLVCVDFLLLGILTILLKDTHYYLS